MSPQNVNTLSTMDHSARKNNFAGPGKPLKIQGQQGGSTGQDQKASPFTQKGSQTWGENEPRDNAKNVNGNIGKVVDMGFIQKWDKNSAAGNSRNVNGNMDGENFMAFMK